MFELDTISDLVTNRSHVYNSIPHIASVGFSTDVLEGNATMAMRGVINTPAFKLNIQELNAKIGVSGHTRKMPLIDGSFTLPFDSFSIILESDDGTAMIFYIDRLIEDKPMQHAKGMLDDVPITERLNVVVFARPASGKNKGNWIIQYPLSILGTKDNSVIPSYWGIAPNISYKELERRMGQSPTTVDGNDTAHYAAPDFLKASMVNVLTSLWFITTAKEVAFKSGFVEERTPMQVSKAKKPFWEYRLVSLKQVAKEVLKDSLGGSHSSPRYHLRRGHWRTLSSGKEVFVKSTEVGKKEDGIVEKDYEVT